MAVPKRRLSKCRRDRRRANWKLEAPGYVACPQCHEPKMPHRVCPTCGHYKGEQVVCELKKDAYCSRRLFCILLVIYNLIYFICISQCHYFIVI